METERSNPDRMKQRDVPLWGGVVVIAALVSLAIFYPPHNRALGGLLGLAILISIGGFLAEVGRRYKVVRRDGDDHDRPTR
jgi:hypothetical protein